MTFDAPSAPEDDLDGHTMEELGDYLNRGRTPVDLSIENSAACRLALSNMARMQELTRTALERESARDPARDEAWISGLLDTIKTEIRSGRDIPVVHPNAVLRLVLTEAAVRGIIRRAGDTMDGVIMGRCALDGDVSMPGAPIRIEVTASLQYGMPGPETADALRERIAFSLAEHTDIVVSHIDVTIDDVFAGRSDNDDR